MASLPVTGSIRIGSSRGCPNYYANYAEVSHTSHDFGIAFVELPARLSADEKQVAITSGEITADPIAQIVIPATLVPGLIRALKIQRDKYEKNFGAIRDDDSDGDKK